MGTSPYAIFSGLFAGAGGAAGAIGNSIAEQQKQQIERDRLALDQQRADDANRNAEALLAQNLQIHQDTLKATDAGRYTDLAPLVKAGILPASLLEGGTTRMQTPAVDAAMKQYQVQQGVQRDQERDAKTAAFLQQAKGQPGVPAPDDAAMYSEGKPATPQLSKWDTAAGLSGLGHKDAALTSFMNMLFPPKNFVPLSENAPGVLNPETGETRMFDRPDAGAMPQARPGFEIETTTDKNGRVSYHEKRINSGVDHDALARERGFGSFAQAPTDVQKAINAQIKQDRVDVSAQQGAVALGQRPLSDQEQGAIGTHNNILASTALLKQFSPQEIALYTGLINRPIAEIKNALAGAGIIDADKRFNEFKPIMGRLQGTAFGEGGKQLTGTELAVVSQYTPTGSERGGAPEVMAKVRNLEAFTKIAREARLYMAKTGRGAIDADQLDQMIQSKMSQAGMAIPQPAAGWSAPGSSAAAPAGAPNTLSRQDPLYSHARGRGMSDQQIQTKYGITLVP